MGLMPSCYIVYLSVFIMQCFNVFAVKARFSVCPDRPL